MKFMHSEWQHRLRHWMETLRHDLYVPLGKIEVESFLTMDHLTPQEAEQGSYTPMPQGTKWGHTWEYCWMRSRIVLPDEAQGCRIAMDLQTGGESTVFVDGKSFGTRRAEWVQVPHHYIVDNFLTDCGEAGRAYDLLIEAYAGHFYPESPVAACATGPVLPGAFTDPKTEGERAVLGNMTYGIWNEEAYQLYMDMNTLLLLGDQLDQESLRADHVAQALERASLVIDFEQPMEGRVATYRAARDVLKPVLEAVNGSTMPVFYAIGNAHLDLAWLWPMAETHRKTSRTFAQQLRLLEEYPEYKYLQSQPAAYEMCREHYPELFERIRAAAKEGRWIPEGAMWVEPDTNMTSGESLVRQVLHGKRYFRDVFGVDSVVLWLPDTFGYSAALPQILNGTGVKYLVTQKIFWSYNEGDQFPYHYFTWQGADGSKIDSFLPTSYTYRTDPEEICETWKKRVEKRGLEAFLLPFGYGDGGGGPTRDHIEYLMREHDLEGMPRVKIEGPVQFFEDMEAQGGPRHTYVGELYFSAHRGVFTSQAAIKKGNRRAELALREAEMWGSMAMLKQAEYPLARMDAAWKKLLLNQFHDILPGSSIARVYEQARQDIARVRDTSLRGARDALLTFCRNGLGLTVFNPSSHRITRIIRADERFTAGAVTREGVRFQAAAYKEEALVLACLEPMSAVTMYPAEVPVHSTADVRRQGGNYIMQNSRLRAVISKKGELLSLVLLQDDRERVRTPSNVFHLFRDLPRMFDAWDIDSQTERREVPMNAEYETEIVCASGLFAELKITTRFSASVITQWIRLTAEEEQLEFITEADWQECHRLLKVSFDTGIDADNADHQIQFGYLSRPAHRSRQYDADRFEVCAHGWTVLRDAT